jgi:hypothetical protein
LLPESTWKRQIHFPQLATDKTAAVIEVALKVPGPGVKGLKEVSGHLQYEVSGGTKEVDLGLENLKSGAIGTALGARIDSIKEGWQKNGSQQMELKLNLQPSAMKSMALVANGVRTELRQSGYSGGGSSYTFTYELKEALPEKGQLVAEVYDKMQTFNTTFKVENITLLGAGMGGK